MSRIINTTKNISSGIFFNGLGSLLGFISRTVFIYTIGTTYLGINGLFTNLLSILSFAELGIGTAINYSLYKPLSNNDKEMIKSLMYFYKRAYNIIGYIIGIIGILILPFISILIKGGDEFNNLHLIYLIFLFNTVSSYFFTYKRTLLIADQKNYLIIKFNTIFRIITFLLQMIALISLRSFIIYLLIIAIMQFIENIYINKFIDKQYPYILEKEYVDLSEVQLKPIKMNVKGMLFHKFGDICVNQTDNIIMSSIISVTMVGLVSNYTMLINIINGFIMSFMNSASASFGNLIASEDPKKRLEVFNIYNFISFCIFFIATVCFYNLLNPFIVFWIGKENTIPQITVSLILLNFFMLGMRVPLGIVKNAAGIYHQDRFVPIVHATVNLLFSVILAYKIGINGVYIGTIVSGLAAPVWYRPIVTYKYVFECSSKDYFIKYLGYMILLVINIFLTGIICNTFGESNDLLNLLIRLIISILLPGLTIIICYRRTYEFRYIKDTINTLLKRNYIKNYQY